jgi:aspartate aminotransferase-like enzyme
MRELMIMTPGPTFVADSVRKAMAQPITSPIVDDSFFDFYKDTTELLQQIMETKNDVLILNGEGILGLEATCASLTERGDRVLVLSNGIFGEGFGEFIEMYGGECTYYRADYKTPFVPDQLRAFLEKDHDFKYATLVHCETPSGLVNPIEALCPILKEYDIVTVVDAVSSIGGIPIASDEWQIDMLLGGSQKCLSAPPGLSFLSISEEAKVLIANREQPIIGFYCNLTIWNDWYAKKRFPYTQPVSDIYALREAAERHVNDPTVWKRHLELAQKVRVGLLEMGLELYPESGFSDTVTAFCVPEYMDEKAFRNTLHKKHGLLISGAFGVLAGKVLRIGHMGENCYEEKIDYTLACIKTELEITRNH